MLNIQVTSNGTYQIIEGGGKKGRKRAGYKEEGGRNNMGKKQGQRRGKNKNKREGRRERKRKRKKEKKKTEEDWDGVGVMLACNK